MAYQIIVFEPDQQRHTDALWAILRQRLRDLDIDLETGAVLIRNLTSVLPDQKAPAAAVYFGGNEPPSAETRRAVADLLAKSITVLPVVDDLRRYQQLVPEELHPINGFELDTAAPNYEAIAARVLEVLALLRETRRLFISYRRSDSREVAIQLYEALDEKRFDVFLDTVSIQPGEEFQKVLAHRLADVDVIVLLHTRDFIGSRWTIEEFTQANAMNVAILRLEWPEIRDFRNSADPVERDRARLLDEQASLSDPLPLGPDDFDAEGRLIAAVTKSVVDRVEALRARALAARQAKLMREFVEQARQREFSVYPQPQQYLLLRKLGRKDLIAYPAVGAPSALTYEHVCGTIAAARQAKDGGDGNDPEAAAELFVLYDNRALLERHLAHLAWLDANMSAVRSIAVADAARILGEEPG